MPKQLFKFDPVPHERNSHTDVGDGTIVLERWATCEDGKKVNFAYK
jgi:hypothetical protein